MLKIFHQSVEDILKAATPEQKILWNHVFLTYGERISISQLFHQGGIGGEEFSVYSAVKMYLAYELEFGGDATPALAGVALALYNRANANDYVLASNAGYWDATAAAPRFLLNTYATKNILFSRAVLTGSNTFKFSGYRIIG